ncbi:Peptidase_S8 domain-containing protein [Burkholderia sp. IT-111MI5]
MVAAYGARSELELTAELLDLVAEIRFVEPNAEFYLSDLTPVDQAEWVDDLLGRTTYIVGDEPHVCILDTGVNLGHPLLEPALNDSDSHAYDPTWGKHDHDGHGSEMAGIALYGDLTAALNSDDEIELPHRLESVKILPPRGATPPHLWGAVTTEAISRVEVDKPDRNRLFAMMTTSVGHLEGNPSEWSASIDQLAFGKPPIDITSIDDEPDDTPWIPRLFVLSAGNVQWGDWVEYPRANYKSPVQNPGQSWNALTVGAATNLTHIDKRKHRNLEPIAKKGELSPASTTSILWAKSQWPFKPDVVAEGGNGSMDGGLHPTVGPESLRVLTTSNDATGELLSASGDTSGAAAAVARVCAHLQARYPDYWPETIRALIVHGAEYTDAMFATLPESARRKEKEELLRTYGYGLVKHEQSEYSTAHRPTLVVQREFNPYRKSDAGGIVLGEMQLHDLPWPTEELESLGGAQVEMRVTLSYFVEPNPSSRGWQSKFRYQSYALRFAVKGASEEEHHFMRRINKLERDEDEDADYGDPDKNQWRYGAQLRARGSLHSDVWTGTAAQLAAKAQIAVFPVGGWWKDWKELRQWDETARYALLISLHVSEDIDADIYTPIATIIEQEVEIDVDIDDSEL